MGAVFNTVKWFVFALNIICVVIGLAVLFINVLGVKDSTPGTDGHAFFILGMLLCSLLCMTTIIGCYGVCSENFGVNVIYSIFMLSLLIIQYLQIRSFQPHGIYFNTLQDLETAWRIVGTEPKAMDEIQIRLDCCGLFNEQDYAFKHLTVPNSCVNVSDEIAQVHQRGCLDAQWRSHIFVTRRQELFNWALLVTEFLTLFYSVLLCSLIFRRRYRSRQNLDHSVAAREVVQHNNVGSRHRLV